MKDEYEGQPVWCTVRRSNGLARIASVTLATARRHDDGNALTFVARWDVSLLQWVEADEHHEPPPPPEPQFPWKAIDDHGYEIAIAPTRSEAEAECPKGGRVMKLVDADVDEHHVPIAAVLRSSGIPMTGGDDE